MLSRADSAVRTEEASHAVRLPSGVMPKRGLDVSSCEVFKFYKLVTIKSLIEPLSMIVPRRVRGLPPPPRSHPCRLECSFLLRLLPVGVVPGGHLSNDSWERAGLDCRAVAQWY